MSEQGGNWTDGPDETERGADPVREHLDKAENWLALAEGNLRAAAGWLDSAETARSTDTPEADRAMWGAARLAELNLSMAQTINDLTPQRYVLDSTIDVERAVREQITAENADYVAAMAKRLGEQLKADDEAYQAVTLRPGADPEPDAEGELWTTGDGWFYYAVDTIPPMLPGMVEKPRWLLARHYAQVLRWSSEQGTKPMAYTWSEVADHSSEGGSVFLRPTAEREVVLRRPTAEERATFYGPEPDPEDNAPTPPEAACSDFVGLKQNGPVIKKADLCERCGASAQAHVDRGLQHLAEVGAANTAVPPAPVPPAPVAWFPEDDVTMKAWLRGLDPAQLNRLRAAASNEHTERLYAE